MTQHILGIDFGTTNTYAAVIDKTIGKPNIIVSRDGKRYIPSVVALTTVALTTNKILVGNEAKNQSLLNPDKTFYNIKSLLGKSFEASQDIIKHVPFHIVRDNRRNGAAAIQLDRNVLSPQEISAYILIEVKKSAERMLGEDITKAVLTVPAYFDYAQCQAIKDAGNIAGLEILEIINNPTAIALAYGLENEKNKTVAVYHLGGATFDISILNISDKGFEVLATNSDLRLGDKTIDDAIVDLIINEIRNTKGIDLKSLEKKDWLSVLQRIKLESEKAKIALSYTMEYEIYLPYLTMKSDEPISFEYKLKRSQLEAITTGIIENTVEPCLKALRDAGIPASGINEVLLEGGMAYMPLVAKTVERIFNRSFSISVPPNEATALGAAIHAGIL